MLQTHYLYSRRDEFVEVKPTGRTAKQTLESVGTAQPLTNVYVEVEPVDSNHGRWKEFVLSHELLEITED